ncbi:MAG TPA: GNAT family N-acetyltransferase [Rhizomicrobium sp.]|nr:GNAT family N-acetyltransferase [Rhizomicrobium sp.]
MTVTLRRATEADIPFVMACERRPGYDVHVGRWEAEQHRATMADPDWCYLAGLRDGAPAGIAILSGLTHRNKNLHLKRIASHDAGTGFGKSFLKAIIAWAFSETKAERFWLEVVDHNTRGRHVYAAAGMVEEGVVRGAFDRIDGTGRGDFIQMSILKREWQGERVPAPPRLNQATAPAVDLAKSIAFYEALGFKLIVRNDRYARFEVGDGPNANIDTFSLDKSDTPAGNGPSLYFECADLDSRVAALKAKGIAFDSDPEDKSWRWREAWLTDPAGVKLCLYWAGENRRFPPWRLA